jgi:hypothetical protein
LGFNYRFNDKLRGGVTITTPSFSILSSAEGTSNATRVNIIDGSTGDFLPDYFYDGTGQGMKMTFKDPLSIAVGLDYNLKKLRWNVTVEWFAGLAPYKLVDQTEGEVDVLKTTVVPFERSEVLSFAAGGKSIANIALGLEIYNKNHRSVLVGFKTDFDALNNFDYQELSHLNTLVNAKSNYYHFSAGKSFLFLKYDVLFGLQYSLSRQKGLPAFANFAPPIDFAGNNPYELEGPIHNNMNYKGDALTLFVGLTLKN